MSHYDNTQWADYVRGLQDPPTAAAMRAHLDSGCDRCGAVACRLDLVAAIARTDERYEPPAHVIQFAKAAFSLHEPQRMLRLPELVATLLFNTLGAPQMAGVRGVHEDATRQTLFEAGDFSVHLRFEQPSRASRVSLVGQIANRRTPEPPMAHVPVLLTRGRTIVARSLSNEFGEFQVEYEPRRSLQLHIPVPPGGQRIRVSLTDLHRTDTNDFRSPASPSRRGTPRAASRGTRRRH